MATRFEIIVPECAANRDYADKAVSKAFDELELLEDELSKFRGNSDIARINLLKPGVWLPVGMAAFDCLGLARAVHEETAGAFDVTVGPLMSIWRAKDGSPRRPSREEFEAARSQVGCGLLELDQEGLRVRVVPEAATGLSVDLGGVGKGYAIDQMATLLGEWGIMAALINGGESTVYGHGAIDGEEGWPVGLVPEDFIAEDTLQDEASGESGIAGVEAYGLRPPLTEGHALLRDLAFSGSGFAARGAHVMDPRRGRPVPATPRRMVALAPTAAMADALSTAFLVMKREEIVELCKRRPEIGAAFIGGNEND